MKSPILWCLALASAVLPCWPVSNEEEEDGEQPMGLTAEGNDTSRRDGARPSPFWGVRPFTFPEIAFDQGTRKASLTWGYRSASRSSRFRRPLCSRRDSLRKDHCRGDSRSRASCGISRGGRGRPKWSATRSK